MNSFLKKKTQLNNITYKLKSFLLANDTVTPIRKVYAVFIAIGLGLLIGLIPIEAVGGKSIYAYELLFTNFKQNKNIVNLFVILFVTYGLLALGTGVAFKAGLFNIGATGQFMAGGWIVIILGIDQGSKLETEEAIPIMLILSIGGGALVASLAAILKVLFRINEVVSTLLLNWVVFYTFKIALFDLPNYRSPISSNTRPISSSFTFEVGNNQYLLPLILFLVLVVIMWFILTFTTFGFKVKACGRNIHAAKANGINVNLVFISTFAISGALCGLGGAIFFVYRSTVNLNTNELPLEGFNAIAISLLAFNEPLGIIFTSLFFSIIEVGRPATSSADISPEAMKFIISIIIFFSALTAIFIKTRPLKWIIEQIVIRSSKDHIRLVHDYVKTKNEHKKNQERQRYLRELKLVKKELKKLKLDVKQISRINIKHLKLSLNYQEKLNQLKKNIKTFNSNSHEINNKNCIRQLDFSQEKIITKIIKKHPLIEKRREVLSSLAFFDLQLEEKKSKIKVNKKIIIKNWYKSLNTSQLFFMRVVA